MELKLNLISYSNLNARQKENYNYQKLTAVLADYGYVTHRLSDDWQGADFIAQHIDGETFIKVQLKGRLTFDKKYFSQEIFVAFQDKSTWYLYDHDELFDKITEQKDVIIGSKSWDVEGAYSFSYLPSSYMELLEPYSLN